MTENVSQVSEVSSGNIAVQVELKRAGRRKLVRHGGTLCGKCYVNPPRAPGQGYCVKCHNAYNAAKAKEARAELKRLRALQEQVA